MRPQQSTLLQRRNLVWHLRSHLIHHHRHRVLRGEWRRVWVPEQADMRDRPAGDSEPTSASRPRLTSSSVALVPRRSDRSSVETPTGVEVSKRLGPQTQFGCHSFRFINSLDIPKRKITRGEKKSIAQNHNCIIVKCAYYFRWCDFPPLFK